MLQKIGGQKGDASTSQISGSPSQQPATSPDSSDEGKKKKKLSKRLRKLEKHIQEARLVLEDIKANMDLGLPSSSDIFDSYVVLSQLYIDIGDIRKAVQANYGKMPHARCLTDSNRYHLNPNGPKHSIRAAIQNSLGWIF